MGAGLHGGIKNTHGANLFNSISSNLSSNTIGSINHNANKAAEYFPYKDGLFGSKNRNPKRKPREIFVNNPNTSASTFFNTLSAGGKKESFDTSHGKGIKATLKDGSIITYRPTTSSNGSPAVEIVISGSNKVKPKKYHIIRKESDN